MVGDIFPMAVLWRRINSIRIMFFNDSPPKLLSRIRGEYSEMPGLRLTPVQASRLWQLDSHTCDTLLTELTKEGFLILLPSGRYALATAHTDRARSVVRRAAGTA